MARQNIGATLSIKDGDFTSKINSAVGGTSRLKNATIDATGQLKKMSTQSSNLGSTLKSATGRVLGIIGAYAGFTAVKNLLMDSVKGINEVNKANARLEQLMGNVKGTTEAQISAVKTYSDELEILTNVTSDASIAGASQLASFALNGDTIKKLLPSMADLSVATYGVNVSQEQIIGTANLMGKVMGGQVGALSKVGVTFDATQKKMLESGTEAQKTATLIEVLKQNYGGLAEKMAQTPEGQILKIKNAWGAVKDVIGTAVLPVLAGVSTWFAGKLPSIQTAVTNAIKNTTPTIKFLGETLLPAVSKGFENTWKWGVDAFNNIKKAIDNNRPAIDGVKTVAEDVGIKLQSAFENSKPILNWLKDTGLPLVAGEITKIVTKATELYDYINTNWSTIGPIVDTITAAVIWYNAILLISTGITKGVAIAQGLWSIALGIWAAAKAGAMGMEIAWMVLMGQGLVMMGAQAGAYLWGALCTGAQSTATGVMTAVTWVQTAAQWALNAAMLASPTTWIIIGIVALIAVFVLLWNNCDGFRNFFIMMWDGIVKAALGAGDIIKGVVNGIIWAVNGMIKLYVGGINGLISGVNAVSGALGIPAIPSIPVPQIPQLATGGIIRRSGRVMVGERGPEYLDLPQGAKVTPLSKTSNKTDNNITINVYADGKSADEIINEVVPRLKLALANL